MTEEDFETGTITGQPKEPRSREEIKEIAIGMIQGNIFHSLQIRKGDEHLLQNIFMAMIFLDEIQFRDLEESGAYSFYGKLTGQEMYINGYPTLFSMGWMTKDETDQLIEIYNKIQSTFRDI